LRTARPPASTGYIAGPGSSIFLDDLLNRYLFDLACSFNMKADDALHVGRLTIFKMAATYGFIGLSPQELFDEIARPCRHAVLVVGDSPRTQAQAAVAVPALRYLTFVKVRFPRTCAYRTCRNLLADEYRGDQRFAKVKEAVRAERHPDRRRIKAAQSGGGDGVGDSSSGTHAPEDLGLISGFQIEEVRRQNLEAVRGIIRRLLKPMPGSHRELIHLRIANRLSIREAGRRVAMDENTAKSVVYRFNSRVLEEYRRQFPCK
jgi:DNA-directed RNA polymerase specialized sigma24 family protein